MRDPVITIDSISGASCAETALEKPPATIEVAAIQAASERLGQTDWFLRHRQMGFFLKFGRIEHDDIFSPSSITLVCG